jgi:hypothetical protein
MAAMTCSRQQQTQQQWAETQAGNDTQKGSPGVVSTRQLLLHGTAVITLLHSLGEL